MKLIAHVKQLQDGSWAEPHDLDQHLEETAFKATEFAKAFGSETWARAVGLAHDTGKSPVAWQKYLRQKSGYDAEAHLEGKVGKMDHSSPGAKLVENLFGKWVGRILSYCIAGHHAGLPDAAEGPSALSYRLSRADWNPITPELQEKVSSAKPGSPPWTFANNGLDLSLWVRMLFSCLVDADFLDTEGYMKPEKAGLRGDYLPINALLEQFNVFMKEMTARAERSSVNEVRQLVLAECRSAAQKRQGIFSLTVPTGGGKTLSTLAFGLEHANRRGLDRIIYVIPYTSIIEQNADVFRAALGDDQIIEHHSNLDDEDTSPKARLAAENWDAPLIVTTSVQFFESLFAAKPSRCRKLHNIAKSVVILDEAQLMPTAFLAPILRTMDLLTEHYGVTFVISTATQPALGKREGFEQGLQYAITEIIADVPNLYRQLKRATVVTPNDPAMKSSWEEIAKELQQYNQVLCVVSDRRSCRDLHRLMPKGTIHLSALMCGQHRSDVIAVIKEKLKGGEPIRVISTQLVEAGVDLDFPVVYRALAGLDSIAQAAGRCNREGRMVEPGKVVVFRAPKKAPPGILRKAAETTETMLKAGLDDPLDPIHFERFFSDLYWKANSLDEQDILSLLGGPDLVECAIQFRTAADKFRIIDDKAQRTVLVPYNKGGELIQKLKSMGPERWLLRKLQRFAVNVYTNDFTALEHKGAIECISGDASANGIYAVNNLVDYDRSLGLLVDDLPSDLDQFVL